MAAPEKRPIGRELMLASQSAARRQMLEAAAIPFRALAADVDEDALRAQLTGVSPQRVAVELASTKALEVSRRSGEALVIGADQILELDGDIFSKATDMSAAADKLQQLAGRTHALHAAVAAAIGGRIVWSHVDTARLAMRALTAEQIAAYLSRAGSEVLASVGCYHLEGLGVNLFERIEGDYFTILGMPLLPLLAELRRRGLTAV